MKSLAPWILIHSSLCLGLEYEDKPLHSHLGVNRPVRIKITELSHEDTTPDDQNQAHQILAHRLHTYTEQRLKVLDFIYSSLNPDLTH